MVSTVAGDGHQFTVVFGDVHTNTIEGFCDFLVIDDPHRVSKTPSVTELETAVDFVRGSLFTRLDQPQKGAIVLIMQDYMRTT
jgi:hypothetical protein